MSYKNGKDFPQNFPFHEKEQEEEFANYPAPSKSAKNPAVYVIAILLIAAAAYGIFKTFYEIGSGITGTTNGSMPVITANNEPFKEVPLDPGGMEIPHLDKQIYNKLDKDLGSTIDQNEDELLPLPSRDDLMAQLMEDQNRKEQINQVISQKKKVEEASKPAEQEPLPKAKRIDVEKVLAKKNLEEIWVQLGTFKAEGEATKAWQDVRENNADVFGDVGIRVTKSENSKGTYYRLQSGPIYNEDEARELCKKLNGRGQSCFYANTKE